MKVVYEALENEQLARLIPDDEAAPIYLSVQLLPSQAMLGDVFELIQTKNSVTLTLIEQEKQTRLTRLKAKREALLNRDK